MDQQYRAEYPDPQQDGWWKITPKGRSPIFFNRADVPPQYWDAVDPLRSNAIGGPAAKCEPMADRPPRLQRAENICIVITAGKGAKFEVPLYYQGFVN